MRNRNVGQLLHVKDIDHLDSEIIFLGSIAIYYVRGYGPAELYTRFVDYPCHSSESTVLIKSNFSISTMLKFPI